MVNHSLEELQNWQLWKQQLAGKRPLLALPTDKVRSPSQRGCIEKYDVILAQNLRETLKRLAVVEKVSLLCLMISAFRILLYRYTGQDDFLIGLVANDCLCQEGLKPVVNKFASVGLLRANLANNLTFRDLLRQSARVLSQFQEHQELANQLKSHLATSRSPLCQVGLSWISQSEQTSIPRKNDLASDVPQSSVDCHNIQPLWFDLGLEIEDTAAYITVCWQYSPDLFEAATIIRIAKHYQVLLEGIVANPLQQLTKLPLLSDVERHRLLIEWNNTRSYYPRDKTIPQLFEEQAVRTPEAIAVVFEQQVISYKQLNCRANQLAHHLQKLGVRAGVLVGLCLERSLEMVVSLLAILKAGGAYVPLDPAYPQERIAYMLSDAQVLVLLTQQRLAQRLPESLVKAVLIDSEWNVIAQEPEKSPATDITPDSLAYVNYTSGSTGNPKGVLVTHRGVTRLLFGVDYARLDATQVFLQLAPISFDATTFELWGALLHGAKCVLFPGKLPTIKQLRSVIQTHNVSILFITTALFNTIVEEAPEIFAGIQQLLTGGEAHSVSHMRKGLEALPSTKIISCYGPTESTTFTTYYPVPKNLNLQAASIPIGRPISNTCVYILDSDLQPVPIGVIGELYIGGDGLAQGYLNRSDLTRERFIFNPFGDCNGDRLYKTGDLVRYLSDGNIEFIGRIDNQAKIRGFRIEPGEIEAVLNANPMVSQSAVIVEQIAHDHKQLVAYVVSNSKQILDLEFVQNYLKQKLPSYMIPSRFVLLEALPLTPNGKVAQRKLLKADAKAVLN